MHKSIKLAVAIIVSELAGIIGSVFTISAIPTWYATLTRPALNPPSWLFGPVWTTLYLLMGIAAFLVWNKGLDRKDVRKALAVFGLQLVLNAAWSIIFFGLHSPLWAFVDIAFMWFTIIWTMFLFYKISKPAMWLLLPYILWVSFAGYLNFMIWILNS
ncbi:MAG: TspO/MBR family protein [Candidatus Paceibacterota bacterium]|jgi:tryptophan-rich sensory protein